ARQVGDMSLADEGKEVMFAQRREADTGHGDDLVVIDLEGGGEVAARVDAVSRQHLGPHPGHPRRGADQPVAPGVLADGGEELAHGPLDAFGIDLPLGAVPLRTQGVDRSQRAHGAECTSEWAQAGWRWRTEAAGGRSA